MCGVFGFVSYSGNGPDLKRLATIARATETRGRHAFGFAWIDAVGRLKMFKQTGRISDNLGLLRMAADAQMLIGHCRWATDGDPRYNINNHPHPVDGGWFVHNGMIPAWRTIARQYEMNLISHCDSEVIGHLIETTEGPLIDRVIDACATAAPDNNLVVLGLWKNPHRLIALRAGNPLHMGEKINDCDYFASLPDGLVDPFMVKDNTALEFTADRRGKIKMTAYFANDAEVNAF